MLIDPRPSTCRALGGPGGLDCCFRATCTMVAADAQGLTCPLGDLTVSVPWQGVQRQHWLFSCSLSAFLLPRKLSGALEPHLWGVSRWVCDRVWARRAPGCGCFGSL